MKTIEDKLDIIYANGDYDIGKPSKKQILDFVSQQIELVVDKALEIASEKAMMKYHCGHTKTDKQTKYHQVGADNLQIDKQSILSLRTQILNEIKDR